MNALIRDRDTVLGTHTRDFLTACRDWAIISMASTANPEVTIHRLRSRRPSGTDSRPVKRSIA